MVQYSTQLLSEGWRKQRASMGIHGLSSSIKSLPLLTCNMLWFIPKTKYYKNNVSPTEYDQLLSALTAVKERYILLKARELTQLSVKVAMFWQIFHPSPRPDSSTLQGSTQWICHMQDVHERKTLSVWLPRALGFDRQPSEAPTAVNVSVHWHAGEKLCFSSVINGTYLSWVASTWRMRAPSCGLGKQYLCLRRLPKMHPQLTYSSCQKKRAQTWIHVHAHTCKHAAKGSGTMRKGYGRTPCNGRWASSGSPTSARRKTSHLWQFPRPTSY